MSLPDSSLTGNDHSTLERKQNCSLSLNDVLKGSLKKAQGAVDHLKIIVRCETLPVVKAGHDDMVRLFDDLLGMILNHPPSSSRLYLYVDCEQLPADAGAEEEEQRYLIRFHTNITTHDQWKLVNSQPLVHCRQILSRYGGTLVVNEINSSGCLFLLSLPGKIE